MNFPYCWVSTETVPRLAFAKASCLSILVLRLTVSVHERVIKFILFTLLNTLITHMLCKSSLDSFSFNKAFRIDFDFLDGKLLGDLVQGLRDLLQVSCALGLLPFDVISGFFDTLYSRYNAFKLILAINLLQ